MKKEILMSFVAAAMMTSCSSDEELSNSGEKFKGNVTLTAEPYTFDDGDTRTTLTNTGSKIAFTWDNHEAIGIFPIAPTTNIQAKQVLKNGSGKGTTSSFDGAGWALIYGNTYAAYYPFQQKEYEDYTKIPIDMTGQIQNGDNDLNHIGAAYDYMYATTSIPTKGNINFDFKHTTSILMLELTMPDEAAWKSVTLASKDGSEVFTTSATMDVATGVVTSTATSSEITLSLNIVSTTALNKTLTLYLAVLPTTTGELTLTAKTSINKLYKADLAGKTLVAGKAYRFAASLIENTVLSHNGIENGHEWVDLGLPSGLKWATKNIGAQSETDLGDYFAWGETTTKSAYTSASYKWRNAQNGSMTKYWTNTSYGTVDYKTTLDPEDDAATQNWGGTWRMPTYAELDELARNCYWVWTSSYNGSDVAGYIVYAAKSPYDKGKSGTSNTQYSVYSLSDSHIFLPAATLVHEKGSFVALTGTNGDYWSSSLCQFHSSSAYYMGFGSGWLAPQNSDRAGGMSVRAVCE